VDRSEGLFAATHDDKKKDKDKEEKTAEMTDFDIELKQEARPPVLPLSRFGALLRPSKCAFTKLQFMDDFAYEKSSEPVFQNFELPLAAFPNLDPSKLHGLRLKFDRTPMRVIILSRRI